MNRLVLLLLFGASLTGCSSQSKKFDVIVTDADQITCDAIAIQPGFEAMNLTSLAKAQEAAWKQSHQLSPSLPTGRVLHEDVIDDQVSAWFEASLDTQFSSVLGPSEVYRGDNIDNEIDATFVATINPQPMLTTPDGTDPSMPTLTVCGELEATRAELLATLYSDDIDGRIRRIESSYLTLGATQCDVAIRCRRDLVIDGAEQ